MPRTSCRGLPKDLARDLADHTAPVSAAAIRRSLIAMAGSSSPEAAFALDVKLISHASTSADLVEGIASFLQKRPPHFTGSARSDLPQLSEWLEGGTNLGRPLRGQSVPAPGTAVTLCAGKPRSGR
jgi:hypothetical protein